MKLYGVGTIQFSGRIISLIYCTRTSSGLARKAELNFGTGFWNFLLTVPGTILLRWASFVILIWLEYACLCRNCGSSMYSLRFMYHAETGEAETGCLSCTVFITRTQQSKLSNNTTTKNRLYLTIML